jgi:histidinol-phosphate aminotransferase
MLKARVTVQSLKEYHPPLAGREGLRLDFNENTVGCSPRVLAKLQKITAAQIATYPERGPVERVIAAHFGLTPDQVLLTNGVDEGLHLVAETYLEPGNEVIISTPTFSMYEVYAGATGATTIAIQQERDFQFPTERVLAAITPRTRMIAMATPNNPTGQVVSVGDIERLAQAAPDAAILVDEAYHEFHGESALPSIAKCPNVLVTRTFSKAYGLAGLRVGVLVGAAEQVRMIRRVSSPYNVNEVALASLPEALADAQYVSSYVAEVKQGRARLEQTLAERGIEYWPSQANFVLFYMGDGNKAFIAAMRERGILVRDRSKDPGCNDCVRITLGAREHNERLFAALDQVFADLGAARQVGAV